MDTMKKNLEHENEGIEESHEKNSYEKPKIEEHEPLEKSTAFTYYYYA